MIKFENTEVMNLKGALRGMRNPLNSWDKADSKMVDGVFEMGERDRELAQRLIKAGSDHRKFMRQIFVSVDITSWATLWAEFDTYKVATVRNSCSKMHRIHVKAFEKADFTTDGIDSLGARFQAVLEGVLVTLEYLRRQYNETKDKRYWRALLELLPHGYNMKATVTLNYETLRNIYHSRKHHKLDEWSVGFMEWINTLPYAEELIKI